MALKIFNDDFKDNYLKEIPLLLMVLGIATVILNLSPVYSILSREKFIYNPSLLINQVYTVSLVLFLAGEIRKKHKNTKRNFTLYVLLTLVLGFTASALLNYLNPGAVFINPSTMPFYG